MTRLYVNEKEVNDILTKITKDQIKRNLFVNVSVKEYRGKKYPENTKVIVIG